MSDRRSWSGAQRGWDRFEEPVYEYTPKRGWDRFEEAVYEYARECAAVEFEQVGYVGPPGDMPWAYEYMPAYFEGLDEDIFEEVDPDGAYIREEAEYRFVVGFRDGWRVACGDRGEFG